MIARLLSLLCPPRPLTLSAATVARLETEAARRQLDEAHRLGVAAEGAAMMAAFRSFFVPPPLHSLTRDNRAYLRGVADRRAGLLRSQTPFDREAHAGEWLAWRQGWRDGR